nr:DUF1003 domain-containing protein [Sphingorhabdus sp.]
IFLNLILSMLAAIQAPIIMMSQNRQAERDRFMAAKDYEINLKAEIEVLALHHKIDEQVLTELREARRELAEHAGWLLAYCLKEGITEIEPTAEAQEAWFHTLLANLGTQPQFFAACTPAYQNGEGSMEMTPAAIRSIPFFGPTLDFVKILEDWRADGDLEGLEVRRG